MSIHAKLFVLAVLAAPSTAQKQASTLEMLTRRPHVVLRIVVTSVRVAGGERQVGFVATETLAGGLTVAPVLREPVGPYCGSACRGLARGQDFVLFAEAAGGRLVPRGGARGLVAAGDGVLAAIRALLRTQDPLQRLRLVVAQLDHAAPRVREDAALALPLMPGLERAGNATKARIGTALRGAAGRSDTRLFGLLMAAVRAVPRRAAETAWRVFLDDGRPALHGFAGRVLAGRLPVQITLATLPLATAKTASQRARAARLLGRTGAPAARPLLEQLATGTADRVRTEAAAALLRLGADPKALGTKLGKDIVDRASAALAERRTRQHRFRAILHRQRSR